MPVAPERLQKYNKLTNAQRNTLARFGVTVDAQGRVNVSTWQGQEVVVSSGNHRVYVLGTVGADDTLISAHGPEYCRNTDIIDGPRNEANVALCTVRSTR